MFFVQLLKIKRQTTSYPVWELRPRELLRMWVCYLLLLRERYIYIYIYKSYHFLLGIQYSTYLQTGMAYHIP